ncbi:glucokinase [Kordiimonas marina]|uniref:glucokinase n=1 Tax=Kordiimonas marina TaxID=2872312 RepID=UPI001FF1B19C|nr:glucokinase [Kordiimonas marina]MCJ9430664.1 glucokinase [Kordiimonas marina]
MSGDQTCIVADIGGTNGRFGVARFTGAGKPEIDNIRIFSCAEHDGVGSMLDHFIRGLEEGVPTVAKLAIAGPTSEREGMLTNLGWTVAATELEKEFGLQQVKLLNDFGALARACLYLTAGADYISLKDGQPDPKGPISVMGPGTGFGATALVQCGEGWVTVPTEAGHMAFAPATRLEHDLTEHLRAELGYVSVETLLCGEGLARIHRFLVDYGGGGNRALSPAEITRLAAVGGAPACTRAVQLFLAVLGGVAGDLVLAHGATGGVFLGGGILPKIGDMVAPSDLLRRFVAKGPMSHYLERVPVRLITANNTALIGAAVA